FGDPIRITEDQFECLSEAFFAEIERRFLWGAATVLRPRRMGGGGAQLGRPRRPCAPARY
ncbi:MAG: hypothetical protein ACLQPH_17490, partial [Acidimicrobiales bacterium]